MDYRNLARTLFLLQITALNAGCIKSEHLRTSTAIVGEGWAAPPPPYDPEPLYCYKTLGKVDCYRMPLANSESRLQGYYAGPQPEEKKDTSFFSFLKPLFEEEQPPFEPVESIPVDSEH